jgi:hypothetical protein
MCCYGCDNVVREKGYEMVEGRAATDEYGAELVKENASTSRGFS